MGTGLSTFLLLGGSLGVGVLASMAANAAREKNYDKAKLWSGIVIAVTGVLITLTLFIIIKSHTGAAAVEGAIGALAVGVNLSYILLVLMMTAISVMQILAMIDTNKTTGDKAMWYDIGSASLSFVGFVVSLFLIIFAA